jgi:tyrosine ammonia-lyase
LINRLTDPVRNGGLPAFLSAGTVGMSSGLMGAQVTATALVAEMRGLATPMSIQSIATNADNQDVVTMGTIAARKAARLLDILWRLLAIEAITASHAMALYRARGEDGFAGATGAFGERILDICPPLSQDRPLGAEIERVAAELSLPHPPDDGFR